MSSQDSNQEETKNSQINTRTKGNYFEEEEKEESFDVFAKGNWHEADDDDSQSSSEEEAREELNHSDDHMRKVGSELSLESEVEPYNFDELPPHACTYCGIHDPEAVVKCNSKDCNKWFCNGKGLNEYGSHILLHLVKSKHKEIVLHPESPLKDTVLECYNCSSKNIFLLGFVAAKKDYFLILLCREPCLSQLSIKDSNWDMENWQPIIENKALINWLVRFPTQTEFKRSRKITPQQINQLEDMWKEKPTAQIKDIGVQKVEKTQAPVLLRYRDPQQYKNIFEPLIKLEADYDKSFKESQTQRNMKVRFDWSMSKKRLAYFIFPNEENVRLVPGDELKLLYEYDGMVKWKSRGTIIKITQNEEICLELKNSKGIPNEPDARFTVEFIWKSTSFDRMRLALKIFMRDETSLSNYIFYQILGYNTKEQFIKTNIPKNLSVQGLPELNHFQMNAVKKALITPLSLIQGPPGTGKTVTSTALVNHLVRQRMGKVLVCAPSNIAVDQLTDKINGTGLKVVRVCARSRESVSSNVDELSLHEQVKQLKNGEFKKMHELFDKKEEIGELSEKDEKQLKELIQKGEDKILRGADVICTTCVAAFDRRLKGFRFNQVLIDEATQATEPETLIPLLRGAKHVILVGDHCQLGPVIMCKKAAKAGLHQSLFERLACLGIRPIRLQVQYRMHPCLSAFPSITFYEGSLQNGISKKERILSGFYYNWPVPEKPMFFFHSPNNEEISASGTSFLNRVEAQNVELLVTNFFKAGLKPEQIGIITPYEGQRAYILSYMQKQGQLDSQLYKEIEVASVDSFQGREKDFILLSCVRSNEASGIGFLNDPRRLNVALTRAKYGLVIFGNAKVLSKHDLWNNLLNEFKNQGCLVEGPNINQLKQCVMVLRRPVQYNPDKKDFVLTQSNLSKFEKAQGQSMISSSVPSSIRDEFDTRSEVSKTESQISYGNRISQFGFTDMFGMSKTQSSPDLTSGNGKSKGKQAKKNSEKNVQKKEETMSSKQGQMLQQDDDFFNGGKF